MSSKSIDLNPTPLVVIRAKSVFQSYGDQQVLHDVNVSMQPNKLTVVTGPSGSGKSTLLNILAGIARPTTGQVFYRDGDGGEIDITELKSDKELDTFRATRAGYVPQKPNLLNNFTAAENICLPAWLNRQKFDNEWFGEVSSALGIRAILGQMPPTLSGGEQQRVSLARALIRKPDVVLADEPSASLDTEAKHALHEVLSDKVISGLGSTVVMVSHDALSTEFADTVIRLRNGRVMGDIAA